MIFNPIKNDNKSTDGVFIGITLSENFISLKDADGNDAFSVNNLHVYTLGTAEKEVLFVARENKDLKSIISDEGVYGNILDEKYYDSYLDIYEYDDDAGRFVLFKKKHEMNDELDLFQSGFSEGGIYMFTKPDQHEPVKNISAIECYDENGIFVVMPNIEDIVDRYSGISDEDDYEDDEYYCEIYPATVLLKFFEDFSGIKPSLNAILDKIK